MTCQLPWTDWDLESFREIWDVFLHSKKPLPLNLHCDYTQKDGIVLTYDEPITVEEVDFIQGVILRAKEIQKQVGQLQLMKETKA